MSNRPPPSEDEDLDLDVPITLEELAEIDGDMAAFLLDAKDRADEWERTHAELCEGGNDGTQYSYRRIIFEDEHEQIVVVCSLCGKAELLAETCDDCGGFDIKRPMAN